jgi:large subunit ribosomal protein L21
MYAVIETGGKQYKVEQGTSLLVDRLDAKEGDKVALRPVMFRDDAVIAAPKELEKVSVEATVAGHLRGPKVKVFKYKAKKGYRRRAGHRSELTKLEVTSLKLGKPAAKKPAEKKEAAEKKPAAKKTAEKKPAEKKAAAKKPAAKKPAAKKAAKPAAKKPAAKKAEKEEG